MKLLEQTIALLDEEERNEFIRKLKSQKDSRKDVDLFKILVNDAGLKASEIVERLYQPANLNAYHSLRKRLMLLLTEFISKRGLQFSFGGSDYAPGLLAVSRYMLEKKEFRMADFYLNKAGRAAAKDDNLDLLENIYNLRISYAEELKTDLDEILIKWKDNQEKYLLRQKLDIAYAVIRKELSVARRSGSMLDPDIVIRSVFKEYNISVHEANNPSFLFRIVSLTRSAIISSKDYYVMEPMVVRIYNRLKAADAFSKKNQEIELGFIYMIAHVHYRNRKFDEASKWVQAMADVMNPVLFRSSVYYAKYVMLSAAIDGFNGNNRSAIDLIMRSLKQGKGNFQQDDRINMQLNLAVYFFQSADYRKALETLQTMGHRDDYLEHRLGKEWRFKKNMIELIVLIELHREEESLRRIRQIEKYFSQFLDHPAYRRARIFLKFIRRVITEPEIVATETFANEVRDARMGWEFYREDIQAITFFCWLKSKMLRRPYYEVLVETMHE